MVYALCGALGAILALFLIAGAGLLLYLRKRRSGAQQQPEIHPPLTEDERQQGMEERARLIAEQRAINRLMNYSTEQAYGLQFTEDEDGDF